MCSRPIAFFHSLKYATKTPLPLPSFQDGRSRQAFIPSLERLGEFCQDIKKYGAVSEEVATAMAKGALKNSEANVAVAITGIAGPSGESKEKPVGLVYIVVMNKKTKKIDCHEFHFSGTRIEIREQTVEQAIDLLVSQKL